MRGFAVIQAHLRSADEALESQDVSIAMRELAFAFAKLSRRRIPAREWQTAAKKR